MNAAFVYIIASRRNGTLYVGVTTDLMKRIAEHKSKTISGFSKRHGVDRLVWFEPHDEVPTAIKREKSLKRWRRAWKIELIEKNNPQWSDLFEQLF